MTDQEVQHHLPELSKVSNSTEVEKSWFKETIQSLRKQCSKWLTKAVKFWVIWSTEIIPKLRLQSCLVCPLLNTSLHKVPKPSTNPVEDTGSDDEKFINTKTMTRAYQTFEPWPWQKFVFEHTYIKEYNYIQYFASRSRATPILNPQHGGLWKSDPLLCLAFLPLLPKPSLAFSLTLFHGFFFPHKTDSPDISELRKVRDSYLNGAQKTIPIENLNFLFGREGLLEMQCLLYFLVWGGHLKFHWGEGCLLNICLLHLVDRRNHTPYNLH